MGLHAHLRDGAPMALIVCVGSFTRDCVREENGGLINHSLREKKSTRVHKASKVQGLVCNTTPQARVLHCLLLWRVNNRVSSCVVQEA